MRAISEENRIKVGSDRGIRISLCLQDRWYHQVRREEAAVDGTENTLITQNQLKYA